MAELREVFEMTTKQMEPDQDSWRDQERRQQRTNRRRKTGAVVVAAAIGLVALVLILSTRTGKDTTTAPANGPTVNPADAAAVEVVTNFLEATATYDAAEAFTYLADDADLTGLIGASGAFPPGAREGFRLQLAWDEATGMKQWLDACESTTVASETSVHCTFDWLGLRADEIGLGPYHGSSFDFTVRGGEIVATGPGSLVIEKFSPQVWEPFAEWVSTTYPKDAAVMYEDGSLTNYRLTEKSIRLWEEHTKEYVKEVQGGTDGQ